MKKIFIIICSLFLLTGCFEDLNFNDSKTYVTLYPIKYATEYLYGGETKVQSIYPNETNVKTYALTEKQIQKYSECETFVYSGLSGEGKIAKDLLNLNNNLQIVDAAKGMNINYSHAELWLDPSNYLMLARNIKETLIDYTNNIYISKDIEDNYEDLKEDISELDVLIYNLGKNGKYNTILISNNLFTYLNKYQINTISLDPTSDNLDRSYTTAKNKIELGEIEYIYTIKGEELDENIISLINSSGITKIEISLLENLTNDEFNTGENYITLMKKIIDEYKRELYK